jgi:hypothetical protein
VPHALQLQIEERKDKIVVSTGSTTTTFLEVQNITYQPAGRLMPMMLESRTWVTVRAVHAHLRTTSPRVDHGVAGLDGAARKSVGAFMLQTPRCLRTRNG